MVGDNKRRCSRPGHDGDIPASWGAILCGRGPVVASEVGYARSNRRTGHERTACELIPPPGGNEGEKSTRGTKEKGSLTIPSWSRCGTSLKMKSIERLVQMVRAAEIDKVGIWKD